MKNIKLFSVILFLFVVLTGCSSGGEETLTPSFPEPPTEEKIPIYLKVKVLDISSQDFSAENDWKEEVGVYVVNHVNGVSPVFQNSGNYVDNLAFVFDGCWKPKSPVNWVDAKTLADLYVYYPYGKPKEVSNYFFQVKENQNVLDEYEASDFLLGKVLNVQPTIEAVPITLHHLFSSVIIQIVAGKGFTEESLKAANVSVKLNGQKQGAIINLSEGSVLAAGSVASIIPYKEVDVYKAWVVPQTVSADNFVTVMVDGTEYDLKKTFTFIGGVQHRFSVTVSKSTEDIHIGIDPWKDDGVDHGGTAD